VTHLKLFKNGSCVLGYFINAVMASASGKLFFLYILWFLFCFFYIEVPSNLCSHRHSVSYMLQD